MGHVAAKCGEGKGACVGEVLLDPDIILGTGPLEDYFLLSTIEVCASMRPEDITRMVRRHASDLSQAELAELATSFILNSPAVMLGEFFKKLAETRLQRV